MKDTSCHITKKQLEIWLAKPVAERFKLALSTIDEVNKQTEKRIKDANPNISEVDLRAEFIIQNYKHDLPPKYLQEVVAWIRKKNKNRVTNSSVDQAPIP
jgi:hypothetical protein